MRVIAEDSTLTRATLNRLEDSLSRMTESVDLFRGDVATLKAQQENQRHQIQSMEKDWKEALSTITGAFRDEFAKAGERIDGLGRKIEERDRPQRGIFWAAVGSVCAALAIFITVGAFIINSATYPISQRITGLEQLTSDHRDLEIKTGNSTAADARSEQDRAELNRRMNNLEGALAQSTAERREQFARLVANNVEVETQFKSLTSMLYYVWEQVTHSHWPIVPREDTR